MQRIGVLAGAFNPLTRAHLALAEAAEKAVDEVVWAVPRVYPHKHFYGAAFEDRIGMLQLAGGRYRVEAVQGGLFIDIARELQRPGAEISFICGRDAAQRVIEWSYGSAGPIEKLLAEFSILVADRAGIYEAPEHLRHRVHRLQLDEDFSDVSSTEVRRRIAAGEPWEHLVPDAITARVRAIYAA